MSTCITAGAQSVCQEMTLEEFSKSITEKGDLCDLGYTLREIDWKVYCAWICDCAERVLPLLEGRIQAADFSFLQSALVTARDFAGDPACSSKYQLAVTEVANIEKRAHAGGALYDFTVSEAFSSVCNAIKHSEKIFCIYHEDVIYDAARAAYDGGLHIIDSADSLGSSDCNDDSEMVGYEQSHKEEAWQLQAMKSRVAKATN